MNIWRSIGLLAATALVAGAIVSGQALGQTKTPSGYNLEDFQLRTSADLLDICTLDPNDPDEVVAKAFCYGFIEGAAHYDEALAEGSKVEIFCGPDSLTREQAVNEFVAFVRANPQYMTEAPVSTIFRALIAKWPCE
jgi:hypothetical protein